MCVNCVSACPLAECLRAFCETLSHCGRSDASGVYGFQLVCFGLRIAHAPASSMRARKHSITLVYLSCQTLRGAREGLIIKRELLALTPAPIRALASFCDYSAAQENRLSRLTQTPIYICVPLTCALHLYTPRKRMYNLSTGKRSRFMTPRDKNTRLCEKSLRFPLNQLSFAAGNAIIIHDILGLITYMNILQENY